MDQNWNPLQQFPPYPGTFHHHPLHDPAILQSRPQLHTSQPNIIFQPEVRFETPRAIHQTNYINQVNLNQPAQLIQQTVTNPQANVQLSTSIVHPASINNSTYSQPKKFQSAPTWVPPALTNQSASSTKQPVNNLYQAPSNQPKKFQSAPTWVPPALTNQSASSTKQPVNKLYQAPTSRQVNEFHPATSGLQVNNALHQVTSSHQVNALHPLTNNQQVNALHHLSSNWQANALHQVTNSHHINALHPLTKNQQVNALHQVTNSQQVNALHPLTNNQQVNALHHLSSNWQANALHPPPSQQVNALHPLTNNQQVNALHHLSSNWQANALHPPTSQQVNALHPLTNNLPVNTLPHLSSKLQLDALHSASSLQVNASHHVTSNQQVDAFTQAANLQINLLHLATSQPVNALQPATSVPVNALQPATNVPVNAFQPTINVPVNALPEAISKPVNALQPATNLPVKPLHTVNHLSVTPLHQVTSNQQVGDLYQSKNNLPTDTLRAATSDLQAASSVNTKSLLFSHHSVPSLATKALPVSSSNQDSKPAPVVSVMASNIITPLTRNACPPAQDDAEAGKKVPAEDDGNLGFPQIINKPGVETFDNPNDDKALVTKLAVLTESTASTPESSDRFTPASIITIKPEPPSFDYEPNISIKTEPMSEYLHTEVDIKPNMTESANVFCVKQEPGLQPTNDADNKLLTLNVVGTVEAKSTPETSVSTPGVYIDVALDPTLEKATVAEHVMQEVYPTNSAPAPRKNTAKRGRGRFTMTGPRPATTQVADNGGKSKGRQRGRGTARGRNVRNNSRNTRSPESTSSSRTHRDFFISDTVPHELQHSLTVKSACVKLKDIGRFVTSKTAIKMFMKTQSSIDKDEEASNKSEAPQFMKRRAAIRATAATAKSACDSSDNSDAEYKPEEAPSSEDVSASDDDWNEGREATGKYVPARGFQRKRKTKQLVPKLTKKQKFVPVPTKEITSQTTPLNPVTKSLNPSTTSNQGRASTSSQVVSQKATPTSAKVQANTKTVLPSLSCAIQPNVNAHSESSCSLHIMMVPGEAKPLPFITKSSSDGANTHQCLICPFSDVETQNVTTHCGKEHPDCDHYTSIDELTSKCTFLFCRHCDYVGPNQMLLWYHLANYHSVEDALCRYTKEIEIIFSCGSCTFACSTQSTIETHTMQSHGLAKNFTRREKIQDPTYICKECDFKTQLRVNIEKHCIEQHIQYLLLFVCSVCNNFRSFSLSSILVHIQKHKVKPFVGCSATILNKIGGEASLKANPQIKKIATLDASTPEPRTQKPSKRKQNEPVTGKNESRVVAVVDSLLKSKQKDAPQASDDAPAAPDNTLEASPSLDSTPDTLGFVDAILGKSHDNKDDRQIEIMTFTNSSNETSFQCVLCPYKVDSKDNLLEHINTEHGQHSYELLQENMMSTTLFCSNCKFMTKDNFAMVLHYCDHHKMRSVMGHYGIKMGSKNLKTNQTPPDLYICLHCTFNCYSKFKIVCHSIVMHGEKCLAFKCVHCEDHSVLTFGKLAMHSLKKHSVACPVTSFVEFTGTKSKAQLANVSKARNELVDVLKHSSGSSRSQSTNEANSEDALTVELEVQSTSKRNKPQSAKSSKRSNTKSKSSKTSVVSDNIVEVDLSKAKPSTAKSDVVILDDTDSSDCEVVNQKGNSNAAKPVKDTSTPNVRASRRIRNQTPQVILIGDEDQASVRPRVSIVREYALPPTPGPDTLHMEVTDDSPQPT